jgi:hypothetical protein
MLLAFTFNLLPGFLMTLQQLLMLLLLLLQGCLKAVEHVGPVLRLLVWLRLRGMKSGHHYHWWGCCLWAQQVTSAGAAAGELCKGQEGRRGSFGSLDNAQTVMLLHLD